MSAHDMSGNTCVVTGSSRGIGRGIAERFGELGANVVVNYRSSKAAAGDVVDTIEDAGGQAMKIQADITDFDSVEDMQDRTHEVFGPADVLVNNAGINIDRRFEEMSHDDWDSVLGVHLDGAFHATKAFYRDIARADNGRVINISSIVGEEGNWGQANYATAKSGMFGFTRTLALELAPERSTVNCVAPGFIDTKMVQSIPDKIQTRIQDDTPLGRFGEVEEVAAVVAFLAREEASFITGAVIDVNGGKDL